MPVDYSDPEPRSRCAPSRLGGEVVNFDNALGYLTLPGNESSTWVAPFAFAGPKGIWGKSLLLSNPDNGFKTCATIITTEENIDHIAEARFHSPIAGSIYFRWLAAKETDHHDTLITTDLYHVRDSPGPSETSAFTNHAWKIFVTDIFDENPDKSENNCNVLQLVFDPQNLGNGRSIGDLDTRLGEIKVATNPERQIVRELHHDDDLVLLPSDLSGPHRQLFVVIYDSVHKNNFLACAKIRHVQPRVAK